MTGLTVESGTTPEEFTGDVIGVLDDGIAVGLDMIMVELESPALERAGGIWQGMSGSPVYVDGQLLGAVAYGLSWGPSPIAGVTPFSEMDDYLAARRAPGAKQDVEVDGKTARTIARRSDVSRSQAAQGFTALPVPMGVTGVSQAHRIAREEIFGPVLSVLTFRTPSEAVEKANNTPYGLSAGIWTEKGSRILDVAGKLRAGVVWANTFNKFDPTSPFGGYKESGYGREGGRHGLAAYLKGGQA